MSDIQTTDSRQQWAVDTVNQLLGRAYRYRHKRHTEEPNPSFDRTRWYLGFKQKSALSYCAHCIDFRHESEGGAQLCGIDVVFVAADDHSALVEVKS